MRSSFVVLAFAAVAVVMVAGQCGTECPPSWPTCDGKCTDPSSVATLKLNDKCNATDSCSTCADGFACSKSGVCVQTAAGDCPCTENADCVSGLCNPNGLCASPVTLPFGGSCVYGTDCMSGMCSGGTCQEPTVCGSVLECNTTVHTCYDGTCTNAVASGGVCSVMGETDNCGAGLTCLSGKCSAAKSVEAGDACSTDYACDGMAGCLNGTCTAFWSVEAGDFCDDDDLPAPLSYCKPENICAGNKCVASSGCLAVNTITSASYGCAADQECTCSNNAYSCSSSKSLSASAFAPGGSCATEYSNLFNSLSMPSLAEWISLGPLAPNLDVLNLADQALLAKAVCCVSCQDSYKDLWFTPDVVSAAAVKFQCAGGSLVQLSPQCPANKVRVQNEVVQGCGKSHPAGQMVAIILSIIVPIIGVAYLVWDSQQKFEHPMRKKALKGKTAGRP